MEQEVLHLNLFPAAVAAVRYHLDAVLRPENGPTSELKTRVHLQALIDVCQAFTLASEHLIPEVRRAKLMKDPGPEQQFRLFCTTYNSAIKAKAS